LTIKQLRILPPFAIGRLGSASEPMDNYSFDLDIDPDSEKPLGYRQIRAQPTLIVNENSGEIENERTRRPWNSSDAAKSGRWRRSLKYLRSPATINWCR
jgi:hypothetical protein